MSRIVSVLAALVLGIVLCTGSVPAKAAAAKENAAIERPVASEAMDEFSSSRRGRRNTAIALGVAAGLLGLGGIAHGYYPYPYYGYYGPAYYGPAYYGPAYYYGPRVIHVRPRKVRCWVYDPFRGVRYRTYCYR
ncbi:MAG: hypothetical protein H3C55_01795 [Pseudorhodoplanes sp.]|nr:hypothetical protein [Pseudorhodoplanes sp.]MBW7948070.1 hypothetical protein [Pseudorhodoplanes sp.]